MHNSPYANLVACAAVSLIALPGCLTGLDEAPRTSDASLREGAPRLEALEVVGHEVTLVFSNPRAPQAPEGGFELIVDGARTYTSVVPRLFSDEAALRWVATLDEEDPGERCFQVYARFNSGYVRSNELCAQVPALEPAEDLTVPVVTAVEAEGYEVTVSFDNLSSPQMPEGGFELMVDGERSYTSVVPRLYRGSERALSMRFRYDRDGERCFGVYARFHSGYRESNALCVTLPVEADAPGPAPADLVWGLARGSEMEPLDGATLPGAAYIFVEPDPARTPERVELLIDGASVWGGGARAVWRPTEPCGAGAGAPHR